MPLCVAKTRNDHWDEVLIKHILPTPLVKDLADIIPIWKEPGCTAEARDNWISIPYPHITPPKNLLIGTIRWLLAVLEQSQQIYVLNSQCHCAKLAGQKPKVAQWIEPQTTESYQDSLNASAQKHYVTRRYKKHFQKNNILWGPDNLCMVVGMLSSPSKSLKGSTDVSRDVPGCSVHQYTLLAIARAMSRNARVKCWLLFCTEGKLTSPHISKPWIPRREVPMDIKTRREHGTPSHRSPPGLIRRTPFIAERRPGLNHSPMKTLSFDMWGTELRARSRCHSHRGDEWHRSSHWPTQMLLLLCNRPIKTTPHQPSTTSALEKSHQFSVRGTPEDLEEVVMSRTIPIDTESAQTRLV